MTCRLLLCWSWQVDIGDLGLVPEPELMRRMRKRETTDQPQIKQQGASTAIGCATPGASITYRLNGGDGKLYSEPLTGIRGTLEAKAVLQSQRRLRRRAPWAPPTAAGAADAVVSPPPRAGSREGGR